MLSLTSGIESQDAVLFTREANVAYLCGYTTATWTNFSRPVVGLLKATGELAVIAAETEIDALAERVPDVAVHSYVELRPVEQSRHLPDGRVQFVPHTIEVLSTLLRQWSVRHLMVDGMAAAFPPVAQLTNLLSDAAPALTDASALLWRQRLIKSEWEVEQLRKSCAVLAAAFDRFADELEPGLTEREIHGLLAASVFRSGADTLGYTNVVAGVDRGLFGAPTDRRWQAGDVLYVDGGAVVDGYWADFCRMYVAGGATPTQSEGYARAVRGLDAVAEALERNDAAGDLAKRIAQACGLRAESVGFGRFGHGIGLYMPEPPSIHPLDDTPLSDGQVLCIEPAVEHQGSNFVVEEQCVLRESRFERLSPPAPRSLIEVA